MQCINCVDINAILLDFNNYFYFSQDLHAGPRTLLPHGASFHGYPITINVSCDLPKQEITLQVCKLFFYSGDFFLCYLGNV